MKKLYSFVVPAALLIILVNGCFQRPQKNWYRVIDLEGFWKFSIGDDPAWSSPGFDDSSWETIYAPSSWEDEGFHGYNGYAWYRYSFDYEGENGNKVLYVVLGYIDDVDEVYLNGRLIGSTGSFPPDYETAYNSFRQYPVPESVLRTDRKNTIAVRVYDSQLSGGMLSGDLGIYEKSTVGLDIHLEGMWKFHIHDDPAWKEADFDDSNWDSVLVPSLWEIQGYSDYDGIAWYRKSFEINSRLGDDKLILVLGKIDDLDETYLNGVRIGSTGVIEEDPFRSDFNLEYSQLRGYYIPRELLNFNGKNVIAVRVYDGYIGGGIYEGPVGIVTQSKYREYWIDRKNRE